MAIPILDLRAQYHSIQKEIDAAIHEVLESGQYILGPNVKALEREVAQLCGCEFGIGVASGTDALRLAIDVLQIGPGDEVITTPFTFIASANTISRAGATPVFVDIDPQTFNLDPLLVKEAVTASTKAILPVYLYGQLADMDALVDLSTRHDLPIIEDNAQAFGATYHGRPACSFGIVGCLSFFPTKNLGAYGDAGMIITCSADVADQLYVLRKHGGLAQYRHERLGYNSRLDELQAAVLRVKLRHVVAWNSARRQIAARYDKLLSDLPLTTPGEAPGHRHVYHQYTIRAARRDELREFLTEKGIQTAIYYPVPMHLQEMYADLGQGVGSFPEAELAAQEVLSLPIYPELADEQIIEVATAIRQFYGG